MSAVYNSVASMDYGTFSFLILFIPCAIMFSCSFVIMATAREIGRQMFLVMIIICLVTGFASVIVTSNWQTDPAVVDALLANSPEGTTIVPTMKMPITLIRNILSYFVVGTVGCIAGAWVGSRIHPLTSDGTGNKRKRKKRK